MHEYGLWSTQALVSSTLPTYQTTQALVLRSLPTYHAQPSPIARETEDAPPGQDLSLPATRSLQIQNVLESIVAPRSSLSDLRGCFSRSLIRSPSDHCSTWNGFRYHMHGDGLFLNLNAKIPLDGEPATGNFLHCLPTALSPRGPSGWRQVSWITSSLAP